MIRILERTRVWALKELFPWIIALGWKILELLEGILSQNDETMFKELLI